MKVLQINAVYGHGSTGTIVRDIEQLGLSEGIDSYVASPDKAVLGAKNGYLIGNVIDHKFHALLCRINGKQAYFSRTATRRLLRYIDGIKPDIVHLHNLHSNYIHLNMLLDYLAKKDIKTIVTLHDCWFFTGGCFHFASAGCDRWKHSCGNCPKRKSDTPAYLKDCSDRILQDRKRYLTAIPRLTIIGASKWVADECRKSILGKCDIGYVHNGFDLDIFMPTPSDFRKKLDLEGRYVILAPASKWYSFVNKDTYDYFVNHLEPEMTLVLFGCTTLHQNLPGGVKEVGYICGPKKMAALYSMADVFVNCTREDTFPGVNIEAQACGTPVVTYDATGCRETVDGVCGRAVPTGDCRALFEAVMEIRSAGKQALSERCISWIGGNFEIKEAYGKYMELYRL